MPGYSMNGNMSGVNWPSHMPPYQHPVSMAQYPETYAAVTPTLPVTPLSVAKGKQVPAKKTTRSAQTLDSSGIKKPRKMNKRTWTPDADAIVEAARSKGWKWSQISQAYFPNRTPNAVRKRHERKLKEDAAGEEDDAKLQQLRDVYNEPGMREDMWNALSQKTGIPWQELEAWVLTLGPKKLTPRRAKRGHARNSSHVSTARSGHGSRYCTPSHDGHTVHQDSSMGHGPETHRQYIPNVLPQVSMPMATAPPMDGMLHPQPHMHFNYHG